MDNQAKSNTRTNVVLILADDMGYSDIGAYGGTIDTPVLDRLAAGGVRLTQFYNTARCSPSRASLITGLHPHQAGMAHLQGRFGPYTKQLTEHSVTIAEVLKQSGYGTYMSGKWHLGVVPPHQRGFDQAAIYQGGSYRIHDNIYFNDELQSPEAFGDNYYSTDSMTDQALRFLGDHFAQSPEKPFFLYMAYNAPHFPLQAEPEDIAKYKGRFDQGWDALRTEKFERMRAMGLIDPNWTLSPKEASDVVAWEDEPYKEWRLRAMEVYAAMVDRMDRNIGRIVRLLEDAGQFDNTMIIFLSDNGGNAEFPEIKDPSILPGGDDYMTANGHYGNGWANLSNTPFRMYKHYIHEGGIASPFIVHWPARLKESGVLRGQAVQLTDVMATVVDATGSTYPTEHNGNSIYPMEGVSMMPIFERGEIHKEYLFWEHEGNCGVRRNEWKLVRFYKKPWELYHMDQDGTETRNLAAEHPELVQQLAEQYDLWTKRTNVLTQEEYEKFDSRPNRKRKKQQ